MLDLSSIANAIKSVQSQPPQAQPSVAEATKPVPGTEIQAPVPPAAKGGDPGLGEHLDMYDTEKSRLASLPKEAKAAKLVPDDAPTREVQAEMLRSSQAEDAKVANAKEAEAEREKEKAKLQLLGKGTGLPQPSTDPVHQDLPFLKPLGGQPLGQSIDARV